MKRIFLLIVIPALLVAMGFAQAPAASGNPDQINVKGCVAGSDGNYTVAENNTGKIFKITTSTADLKAFVGQDVNLTGHAGTGENSLAVTEMNMISVHCVTAAAAPAAAVSPTAETASTAPAAAAAAPSTTEPAATVSTPAETASAPPVAAAAPSATEPAATVSTPAEAASTPPAAVTPAAPTMSMPMETAIAPTAAAVHKARPSAQPQKPAASPAAMPAPAKPVVTPVADTAVPAASFGPPVETASAAPVQVVPVKKASTSRSTEMLVSIVVVLLLIGAGVPLYNRWKRRRVAEQTKGQNLSFTKEAKSDLGKSDTTGGRKAA